jgi:hypothetical protein
MMQSSDKNSEEDNGKIKNAIMEMIGNWKVGRDQVHVGSMLVSQIIRTYTTPKLQEQRSTLATIEKIKDIPYIPFVFSPLRRALAQVHRDMGTSRRPYVVPRVVVFFNDARTNPKESITQEAAQLKNQNITVIIPEKDYSLGIKQIFCFI